MSISEIIKSSKEEIRLLEEERKLSQEEIGRAEKTFEQRPSLWNLYFDGAKQGLTFACKTIKTLATLIVVSNAISPSDGDVPAAAQKATDVFQKTFDIK